MANGAAKLEALRKRIISECVQQSLQRANQERELQHYAQQIAHCVEQNMSAASLWKEFCKSEEFRKSEEFCQSDSGLPPHSFTSRTSEQASCQEDFKNEHHARKDESGSSNGTVPSKELGEWQTAMAQWKSEWDNAIGEWTTARLLHNLAESTMEADSHPLGLQSSSSGTTSLGDAGDGPSTGVVDCQFVDCQCRSPCRSFSDCDERPPAMPWRPWHNHNDNGKQRQVVRQRLVRSLRKRQTSKNVKGKSKGKGKGTDKSKSKDKVKCRKIKGKTRKSDLEIETLRNIWRLGKCGKIWQKVPIRHIPRGGGRRRDSRNDPES